MIEEASKESAHLAKIGLKSAAWEALGQGLASSGLEPRASKSSGKKEKRSSGKSNRNPPSEAQRTFVS